MKHFASKIYHFKVLNSGISTILVEKSIRLWEQNGSKIRFFPIGIILWEYFNEEKPFEAGQFIKNRQLNLSKMNEFSPTTQFHNNDQFFWSAIKLQLKYNNKEFWTNQINNSSLIYQTVVDPTIY